jgi:hypothetical protein
VADYAAATAHTSAAHAGRLKVTLLAELVIAVPVIAVGECSHTHTALARRLYHALAPLEVSSTRKSIVTYKALLLLPLLLLLLLLLYSHVFLPADPDCHHGICQGVCLL